MRRRVLRSGGTTTKRGMLPGDDAPVGAAAKREKLIGIKKGMMSDLLTGKVRLKGGAE
jgi:hypothetical protein